MKYKFWVIYLAIVFLFTGIGYFAISNVSDIPMALSDSEMAVLRGTVGSDRKCVLSAEPGCTNGECEDTPTGLATYGYRYNDCVPYTGWYCNYWGPNDAQIMCRSVYYLPDCSDYIWEIPEGKDYEIIKIRPDTTSDCNSRRMR